MYQLKQEFTEEQKKEREAQIVKLLETREGRKTFMESLNGRTYSDAEYDAILLRQERDKKRREVDNKKKIKQEKERQRQLELKQQRDEVINGVIEDPEFRRKLAQIMVPYIWDYVIKSTKEKYE